MKNHVIKLKTPAENWEHGSPIGGGSFGAMVMGGTDTEKIYLCEESIWSGEERDTTIKDFPERVNTLRRMYLDGKITELDEKMFDAGCALSGSGPAYVFMFIEALADGAVACGLPRDKAVDFAVQTVLGSAKLMQETGRHPGDLKDSVCSPAGTTIAGVGALENGGFRAATIDAVKAAYNRSIELGK